MVDLMHVDDFGKSGQGLLMLREDAWDDGLLRMGGNWKNTLFYTESCEWDMVYGPCPVEGWFE